VRSETKPRAGGGFIVTAIDFRTDPVTAQRQRVVSLVTHADIPKIVWADDETAATGYGAEMLRAIESSWSGSWPIKIGSARR
jgi:hypothetical protein